MMKIYMYMAGVHKIHIQGATFLPPEPVFILHFIRIVIEAEVKGMPHMWKNAFGGKERPALYKNTYQKTSCTKFVCAGLTS